MSRAIRTAALLAAAVAALPIAVAVAAERDPFLVPVSEKITYGQSIEPCTQGYFDNARLSDPRWHTSAAIRVGSTARAAQRVSRRSCADACPFSGYVLGLHPSDCAGGWVPSVIAELRAGRVSALRVLTHGCE